MSFTQPKFLLFLAVALAVYFVAPKKVRPYVLLAASYLFYWFSGGALALGAISLTVLSVYAAGLHAGALRRAGAKKAKRRAPLLWCLLLNFGILAALKFSGLAFPKLGTLLIPGISFYTFGAAGYLIDVYRGKVSPERNVLKFALFVSFFPQLIMGPISRYSEVAENLFAGHGWNWERARRGVRRIIWGYFMKLAIADVLAAPVAEIFDNYASYSGAVILAGALFYTFQIYADFAGGINIVLGIGELVGVSLPENFRQPFFARSLTDFWTRWHMSLTRWLRDYLFYPLALSKPLAKLSRAARRVFGQDVGKKIPASAATFAVYIIVGVWHGASLAAFIFGLLNGAIITLSLFCEPLLDTLREKTGIDGSKRGFGAAFAMLRTFIIMLLLRIFARAASASAAFSMLWRSLTDFRLTGLRTTLLGLGLGTWDYLLLAVCIALLIGRDILAARLEGSGESLDTRLNRARPAAQFILTFVVLAFVCYFGLYREGYTATEFIYAQY